MVKLFNGPIYKNWMVHQLILTAFVGPCPPEMECRHFPDRSRTNNRLNNLQWGTPKRNYEDRRIHNTDNSGSKNGRAKLLECDIPNIKELYATGNYTQKQLAKMFGCGPTQICEILNDKYWRHVKC